METINPNVTYESIVVNDGTRGVWRILWEIPGPLSGDQTAGLLSALYYMFDHFRANYNLQVFEEDTEVVSIYMEDQEELTVAIGHDYYHFERMMSDEEFNQMNHRVALLNKYSVWIRDINEYNVHSYRLFTFDTPEFLQGFISICQAFQVNYNDLIVSPIFRFENGTIVEYRIEL